MLTSGTIASRAVGVLLLGALTISWSPIGVRLSEVGPAATAFWRTMLATPVLLILWMVLRQKGELSQSADIKGLILASLFFAADLLCWHSSITLTKVANAALFVNLAPLLVALFSWSVYGERFSRRFWTGLFIAIAGAALVVGSSFEASSERLKGDLLGILTAVFYAGYILSVDRLRHKHSTLCVTTFVTLGSTIPLLIGALLIGERIIPSNVYSWVPLVGLALGPQILGQGAIAFSLAFLPAAFSAVTLLLQPVVAGMLAWYLFGEELGIVELFGAVAILTGIVLTHAKRRS